MLFGFVGVKVRLLLDISKKLLTEIIYSGAGNDYYAYIVDSDAEIGEHYTKVAEFKGWLRIYDDSFLTHEFNADKISIYRAGEMGCIIQLFK